MEHATVASHAHLHDMRAPPSLRVHEPSNIAAAQSVAAARLVGVDSTRESFLFRCVKQTLEAYVEKKLDLRTLIADLKDPVDFLRETRKKQNQVDTIRKPVSITMCQEPPPRLIRCAHCALPPPLFGATHAPLRHLRMHARRRLP